MSTMTPTIGQYVKYEETEAQYSRDNVTVASGQVLVTGQVVGRINATGKIAAYNPGATDGTQNAVGIMAMDVDASTGDAPGVIVARHAVIVDADNLIWDGSPTEPQKDAAIAQLKALGIVARKTV